MDYQGHSLFHKSPLKGTVGIILVGINGGVPTAAAPHYKTSSGGKSWMKERR